jgi:hypothetical protein
MAKKSTKPVESEQPELIVEPAQEAEASPSAAYAGEVKRRGRPKKVDGTKQATKAVANAGKGGKLEEIIRWSVASEQNLEKLYQLYQLVK